MTNYGNPYYNPYAPQTNSFQQVIPQQQVTKVSGENGARAFQMGANSSALLLDESGSIVWLATTDGAGYKTVSPYDITPHKVAPAPDFSSLESRITRLEEIINEHATNTSTVARKNSTKSSTASDASAN